MAATLAVVGTLSFVGASIGISWMREVMPDTPAPYGNPGSGETDPHLVQSPSPTPTTAPTPNTHGARVSDSADAPDQPVRRMPSELEWDEDDESSDDEDDEEDEDEGGTEGDADDPEAKEPAEADASDD